MGRLTIEEMSSWRSGEIRDVAADMRNLTAAIVTSTLFGRASDEQTERASLHLQEALHLMGKPLTKLLTHDLPFLPYRRYVDAANGLEKEMMAILSERKGQEAERPDMLSALMSARDEESGTSLSDAEILGHISVFFAAGHETTSNALAWTLLLLHAFPETLERTCTELEQHVSGASPSFDELEQLTFLGAVIKESLRLFTPAPWNGRILTEDTELGGYHLPKGAEVLFSIYHTHRMPEIFQDPLAFQPERWFDIAPTAFEYSPFSAGPRTCIGAAFATMEMKVVLATVLKRTRLALQPQRIDRFAEMVLAPKHGLTFLVDAPEKACAPVAISGDVHEMVCFPKGQRA